MDKMLLGGEEEKRVDLLPDKQNEYHNRKRD